MRLLSRTAVLCALLSSCAAAIAADIPPDITVAADGSGQFKTVQEAISSIPADNTQRVVVYVKDGVYNEQVNVAASFVTLRGQSQKGTRIVFNPAAGGGRGGGGGSVMTLGGRGANAGSDFILQNITLLNSGDDPTPHAVTVSSRSADRVVFLDSDVLSTGDDTVSLWRNDGRYYHARCNFRGAVDSVCPHGYCYISDSTFFETRHTASIWQDGQYNKDQKYVLRNCKFDGLGDFQLARHHHDALFFFVGCSFTNGLVDKPVYRVLYPLDGGVPTADDIANNKQHDPSNIWGDRNYFFNCHRDGGDYAWFKDNLTSYAPALTQDQITAAWTFKGSSSPWDPETKVAPKIKSITTKDKKITVTFTEGVTVKGKMQLTLADNSTATLALDEYAPAAPVARGNGSVTRGTPGNTPVKASGNGMATLVFNATSDAAVKSVNLDGFAFASEGDATTRMADLTLPK